MEKKFEEFVNVWVRIKPSSQEDVASSCLQLINKQPPVLLVLDKSLTFHFDNVFTDSDTQKDIYEETVKPLVEHVKNGYNSTVFAYGQTGTGKTFTMGTNPNILQEDDYGLIPRTLDDFFNFDDPDTEFEIYISFIEIYNEKVFDLLTNKKTPLSVKGFTVHGFEKFQVDSVYSALQLLKTGGKNRHTGETKQNSNSSRSHAIFTIYCHTRNSERETLAKLNLVDLAGSESVRKTGNQGNSLHEGININKGLLSLGQVMKALSKNSSHVPYRQSIVTTILQDSLNKKNFISLIACVSPNADDLGETLQTLEFSQRVKKMKNNPEVNNFITHYKKDNPSLFLNSISRGLTPSKRSNSYIYETPFKKSRCCMPVIQEPVSNSDFDSSKSMLSSSTISLTSEAQQNLSPVIKKYMNAMENSLMNKLEDIIKNTLRKSRRSSTYIENKENTMTPSVPWDQLAKVVRTEVELQFSTRNSRATSSPLENSPFFKNNHSLDEPPQILKPRNILTYEIDNCEEETKEPENNNDDTIFKVPSVPKTTNLKTNSVRRSSIRLHNKRSSTQFPSETERQSVTFKPENRRRSVRLQLKEANDAVSGVEKKSKETVSSCFYCKKPKQSRKKKLKIPESHGNPVLARTEQVLHILNHGSLKEIETLHTIGTKTAEKIQFFRQMKGLFTSVEDLSEMPYWTKNKYQKFLTENFLQVE